MAGAELGQRIGDPVEADEPVDGRHDRPGREQAAEEGMRSSRFADSVNWWNDAGDRRNASPLRTSWGIGPIQRFSLGPLTATYRPPGTSRPMHADAVWLPTLSIITSKRAPPAVTSAVA